MRHFPIFLNLHARRVVVAGGSDAAIAKLRLLMRTEAKITVFAPDPDPQIQIWADKGKLELVERNLDHGDATCAALVYGATENPALDAKATEIGKHAGALTNIVDNLEDSAFITPAIVDRDPVTVAIGTEGAAPVLARKIKQQTEEALPQNLGQLARIGQAFRPLADKLPMGRIRREFWSKFYFKAGPMAFERGGPDAAEDVLDKLLDDSLSRTERVGHVWIVGAGPGDPELLTLKARKILHEADVVLHDQLVPKEILELARREAVIVETGKRGFGPSWSQEAISNKIIEHAQQGAHVVRLKSGDPAIFARLDEELDALTASNVPYSIVPGITAASAAAASIGQSLTKRGRNSNLRILTAHDIEGFADQDWRSLSAKGAVAAIYMGKRAAKFLRGRLLMHGASENTPITLVENASQLTQKTIGTSLLSFPEALNDPSITGPVVILLGLSPRDAMASIDTLPDLQENA